MVFDISRRIFSGVEDVFNFIQVPGTSIKLDPNRQVLIVGERIAVTQGHSKGKSNAEGDQPCIAVENEPEVVARRACHW